jgi:hypothetical protein
MSIQLMAGLLHQRALPFVLGAAVVLLRDQQHVGCASLVATVLDPTLCRHMVHHPN